MHDITQLIASILWNRSWFSCTRVNVYVMHYCSNQLLCQEGCMLVLAIHFLSSTIEILNKWLWFTQTAEKNSTCLEDLFLHWKQTYKHLEQENSLAWVLPSYREFSRQLLTGFWWHILRYVNKAFQYTLCSIYRGLWGWWLSGCHQHWKLKLRCSAVADLGGCKCTPLWRLVMYFCIHNCTIPSNDYAAVACQQ